MKMFQLLVANGVTRFQREWEIICSRFSIENAFNIFPFSKMIKREKIRKKNEHPLPVTNSDTQ